MLKERRPHTEDIVILNSDSPNLAIELLESCLGDFDVFVKDATS
jgi:hypothetical protein